MQKFSDVLREMRKSRGLTQEQMANLLQIKRATYGAYERDTISPPIEKLKSIAQIFGTTVDELTAPESEKIDIRIILRKLERNEIFYDTELLSESSNFILVGVIQSIIKVEQSITKSRTNNSLYQNNL